MAGPILFIVLAGFVIISTINAYSVLDRTSNKIDDPNLLYNRTPFYSKYAFDKCVPEQAVRQIGCPFGNEFKFICQQHQLCYACGFVHNITAKRCVKLSRMHIRGKCLGKSDCLKSSTSVLTHFEQDFYRTTDFSYECYDKCVLNYLYRISE